jgi:signal transduction histidine kinase
VVATALTALALTAALATAPGVRLAFRSTPLHVAIETAAALVAVLAALLVLGRFRESGRATDAFLASSLSVHALAASLLVGATIVSGGGTQVPVVTWTAVLLSLAGAATFLAAPCVDRVLVRRRAIVWSATGALAAAMLVAFVGGALAGRYLAGVSAAPRPATPEASPSLFASQLVAAAVYLLAAAAFAARSSRSRDGFLGLLGVACVLSGFARVQYALVPSLYTDVVSTGDVFRISAYAVLLGAAFGELARIRSASATLEERRRLARELHDGLAQELVFVALEARGLGSQGAALADAAERALAEARYAVKVLAAPGSERFTTALERVVRQVPCSERVATRLESLATDPPRDARDDLLRIAREAVVNASRHSRAGEIRVELTDAPLTLRVIDDGVGFDPQAVDADEHFGIAGMRARARRIGASISFSRVPGGGTVVEVALP